jgi:hypothetical protein
MSDLLLNSERRLAGPKSVTATVRPLRLALLIDPFDQRMALAAVDACCLTWGGTLNLIIPCPPNEEPEPFWGDLLRRHDPDEIIDLVGAAPSFTERQLRSSQCRIQRWEVAEETMQLHGVLATSVLRRAVERGLWHPTYGVLNLHPLLGIDLTLPLAYRHGHLERRPMDPHGMMRHAYYSSRLEDFAQVHSVDPRQLPPEELIRLVTEYPLLPSTPELPAWLGPGAHSLIGVAGDLVLKDWGSKIWFPEGEEDLEVEGEPGNPFWNQIVVVGHTTSVPDFCLAWNLRAQRYGLNEPIWIDPQWVQDHAVLDRLEIARTFNRDHGRGGSDTSRGSLRFVSASISEEGLFETVSTVASSNFHPRKLLWKLFPDRLRVGHDRRSIAVFVDGIAEVALPESEDIGVSDFAEMLGVTVEIPGWYLPRMPAPKYGASTDIVRIAADGFVGKIRMDPAELPELVTLNARDGGQALKAVAEAAGFGYAISDKGRLAIAIMNLFGPMKTLSLLSSSRVYELLEHMAVGIFPRQAAQQALKRHLSQFETPENVDAVLSTLHEGLTAEGQFERQHFGGSDLLKRLHSNQETASWILRFLIKNQIIYRGFDIICSNCRMRRWLPIDRLATTYDCEGCQSRMPIPLQDDKSLTWSYRLNEVIARGVDQGVLPHLLAVYRLAEHASYPKSELLGFLPGVDFTVKQATKRSTPPTREADFVAILGGRVILGECKRNGGTLKATDIEKTLRLSEQFQNSGVIFATPTSFDRTVLKHAQLQSETGNQSVTVWERTELLDPTPHPSLPKSEPEDYLSSAVQWLSR